MSIIEIVSPMATSLTIAFAAEHGRFSMFFVPLATILFGIAFIILTSVAMEVNDTRPYFIKIQPNFPAARYKFRLGAPTWIVITLIVLMVTCIAYILINDCF